MHRNCTSRLHVDFVTPGLGDFKCTLLQRSRSCSGSEGASVSWFPAIRPADRRRFDGSASCAPAKPASLLLAGVGNLLMSDDGIGIHAIQELQKNPIPGVAMAEIGTAILHGLSFVESAQRVLVIDAAKGGHAPGTIYLFDAAEAAETRAVTSIHALGLREAMRFLSGRQPPPVTVIGIEPQVLDYGMALSAPVQATLPQVVALAQEILSGWLRPETVSVKPMAGAESLSA
jgi:hydrogenase maturation protease